MQIAQTKTLGQAIDRMVDTTVLNIHFFHRKPGTRAKGWVIPPPLRENNTVARYRNNEYLRGLPIESVRHFTSIRATSGYDIYIKGQDFDQQQYEAAQ